MDQPSIQIFQRREQALLARLQSFDDHTALYETIISMGRALPPLPVEKQIERFQVRGCQSLMYLYPTLRDQLLYFEAHSDALISKGLAALAIELYSGLSPETIIRCNTTVAHELQLERALSANRLGGFSSILTQMKREALQVLITPK